MKHLLAIACASSLLVACNPASSYHFSTTASPDDNGKMAYITDYDTGAKIDSVVVGENAIVFEGSVREPIVARLIVDGKRRGTFILENDSISFDVERRLPSGTPMNDRLSRLFVEADSIESLIDLYTDSARIDNKYNQRVNDLTDAYKRLFDDAYHENQGNVLGFYAFYQMTFDMTEQEVIDAVRQNELLKRYSRISKLLDSYSIRNATAAGKSFVEVAYNDTIYHLSDYLAKGNYTLVDFWASWCGPCIRETEVIKDIYKKYNGNGLDVLGVAVWDEPHNTLDAINSHELKWKHIINSQNIATDAYGILSIPHLILFDPEGTIVARGMTGDSLRAVVDREVAKWVPAPATSDSTKTETNSSK